MQKYLVKNNVTGQYAFSALSVNFSRKSADFSNFFSRNFGKIFLHEHVQLHICVKFYVLILFQSEITEGVSQSWI